MTVFSLLRAPLINVKPSSSPLSCTINIQTYPFFSRTRNRCNDSISRDFSVNLTTKVITSTKNQFLQVKISPTNAVYKKNFNFSILMAKKMYYSNGAEKKEESMNIKEEIQTHWRESKLLYFILLSILILVLLYNLRTDALVEIILLKSPNLLFSMAESTPLLRFFATYLLFYLSTDYGVASRMSGMGLQRLGIFIDDEIKYYDENQKISATLLNLLAILSLSSQLQHNKVELSTEEWKDRINKLVEIATSSETSSLPNSYSLSVSVSSLIASLLSLSKDVTGEVFMKESTNWVQKLIDSSSNQPLSHITKKLIYHHHHQTVDPSFSSPSSSSSSTSPSSKIVREKYQFHRHRSISAISITKNPILYFNFITLAECSTWNFEFAIQQHAFEILNQHFDQLLDLDDTLVEAQFIRIAANLARSDVVKGKMISDSKWLKQLKEWAVSPNLNIRLYTSYLIGNLIENHTTAIKLIQELSIPTILSIVNMNDLNLQYSVEMIFSQLSEEKKIAEYEEFPSYVIDQTFKVSTLDIPREYREQDV